MNLWRYLLLSAKYMCSYLAPTTLNGYRAPNSL